MPFAIQRNDIAHMRVDAIVNTANPRPVIGGGVDARIHQAAGPELLEARRNIGPISVGRAAVTPGFRLEARFVIHTVGPVWRGGLFGEAALLRRFPGMESGKPWNTEEALNKFPCAFRRATI